MNQKRKKDLYGYIGITMTIFLILLVVTFVFEKPQIIITNINNEKTSMNEVTIEAKSDERIENPIVHYHFRDISDQVIINDKNVDYDKVGEYSILYEVETLTGKCIKEVKVKIIDTKAPNIILEGGEEYNQSYTKDYEEPGYTAIDEVDGDLSSKIQVSREDIDDKHFKIKYNVKDESGNKAEKTRNVTIVDDIKPEITLNGNSKITIYLNNKYEEKGAKAVDEIDGDLSSKISIEGKVDIGRRIVEREQSHLPLFCPVDCLAAFHKNAPP